MRFIAGTPDIPDELINDVSDGRAVFLCGAGVSTRVGMPLFGKLTDQIYADISETPNNEAAEMEAIKRQEYDRALRSLESKDASAQDAIARARSDHEVTHARGRSRGS